MGSRYTYPVSYTLTNAGGTTDFMSLVPATGQRMKLVAIKMSNGSEVAEAQEEDIRIQIKRLPATVTAGSGGSAFTTGSAGKVKRDAAARSTGPVVRYNDTTPATTSGTEEILEEIAWNVRATPLELRWDNPDDQYDCAAAEAIAITLPVAVADDMTISLTVEVELEGAL